MRGFGWVLGFLGAVSLVMGILTTAGVIPEFGSAFTWRFWFVLSAIMFLSSILATFIALRRG